MAENEDGDQEASAAHDVTDGTPEVGAPIPRSGRRRARAGCFAEALQSGRTHW